MALEISFVGGEADNHHINANDGLESLAGLAHAATLIGHYVATGKVRQRTPYDDRLQFYFSTTKPGSLTAILTLGGALALGAGGNATYDVLKAVWKRATGSGEEGNLKTQDRVIGSGDLDALAEASSPSLLRGHVWIESQNQKIITRSSGANLTLGARA